MTRAIEEWIGKADDQAIPPRVRLRIFDRCGGRCAVTGEKLRPGHFQYDHIVALVNGGRHAESNLQTICTEAHKVKTRDDVAIKAKVARIRKKMLGLWPAPARKLQSRPFPKRGDAR